MKKSNTVLLSVIMLTAISSCTEVNDKWIPGDKDRKDTTYSGRSYRHYHGAWYPIHNGLINPGRYNGASMSEIQSPSYHPSTRSSGIHSSSSHSSGVRSGGFGSSSHSISA